MHWLYPATTHSGTLIGLYLCCLFSNAPLCGGMTAREAQSCCLLGARLRLSCFWIKFLWTEIWIWTYCHPDMDVLSASMSLFILHLCCCASLPNLCTCECECSSLILWLIAIQATLWASCLIHLSVTLCAEMRVYVRLRSRAGRSVSFICWWRCLWCSLLGESDAPAY